MGNITRSIMNPVAKAYPVGAAAGRLSFNSNQPSAQTSESYLRYYKEISWLRAAVAVIAQGIAQSKWELYRKKKKGDREKITEQHDLKDLLNRPNNFQSGHDFLYLHQIFDELIGRNFWVKQKDHGNNELWLLPPQYTSPVSDPIEYISGYKFERSGYTRNFKPEEVIMFVDPDPLDPMNGAGRAQSIGIDIENQSFMSQWNRNFFFWGADPGTVITYPIEANITPDELDRLSEQWNSGHRSYGRAHKAAILTQGATVAKQGIGQRDMDFTGLAKYNRDSILGVFGVSYSMVGGTDNVIRANAEAQLFNFAKWVLTPRLIRIREKLNMFLCPDYGPDLELDYEDPSPENVEQDMNLAKTGVGNRPFMTINEARGLLKLDPVDGGDEIPEPVSSNPFGNFNMGDDAKKDEAKSVKKNLESDPEMEAYWKTYVARAESYEPKTIKALQEMFEAQKAEILKSLQTSVNRDHILIDDLKAIDLYQTTMEPLMTEAVLGGIKQALTLSNPKNPHKEEQSLIMVLNKWAMKWLKTRLTWAAKETTSETAKRLSLILQNGYETGQSMGQIADAISHDFDNYFSIVRAVRIARTEIIAASNIGNIAGYQEAGIEKVKWWTAIDERVCPLCDTLHDKVTLISEGYIPPAHPACRCIQRPVVEV